MNILEIYAFGAPVFLVVIGGIIAWRVGKTGTSRPAKPKDPSTVS